MDVSRTQFIAHPSFQNPGTGYPRYPGTREEASGTWHTSHIVAGTGVSFYRRIPSLASLCPGNTKQKTGQQQTRSNASPRNS
eukprot:2416878-Rhodomonas_salina.2